MLIVKTPPIMAACPRGGFTRGSPWRRASPFLFLPTGPARAEFLFLRPPLKRRRIERHSHPPSPISLSLSLSLLFLPYPPFPPPFLYLPNQPPLFISSSTSLFLIPLLHLFLSNCAESFYFRIPFRETVERFDGVAITKTSVVVQD